MALNEVLDEIRASRKTGGADAAEKPVRAKRTPAKDRQMTKAEREAFRTRKMREEEERYLGKPSKKAKTRKVTREQELSPQQVRQAVELMHANPNPPRTLPYENRRPKMLEPLQPLYLLKIPGLPKGDCLAICLAHGADQ